MVNGDACIRQGLDVPPLSENTMEKLREIISVDIAISYKLMRFLNSAYFYRLQEVRTVKHAIAYLGEKELRRFVLPR